MLSSTLPLRATGTPSRVNHEPQSYSERWGSWCIYWLRAAHRGGSLGINSLAYWPVLNMDRKGIMLSAGSKLLHTEIARAKRMLMVDSLYPLYPPCERIRQSSLDYLWGINSRILCRYQNPQILKSLTPNGLVFVCNLCISSHIF